MCKFISGKRQFRRLDKLQKMNTGNLIYMIRSAALSVNYMNDRDIQAEFKRVARKVCHGHTSNVVLTMNSVVLG